MRITTVKEVDLVFASIFELFQVYTDVTSFFKNFINVGTSILERRTLK